MDQKILSPGTKESYTGPLELVEAIRAALGDFPLSKKVATQFPNGPGDKPQGDSSSYEAQSKRENEIEAKRWKMP